MVGGDDLQEDDVKQDREPRKGDVVGPKHPPGKDEERDVKDRHQKREGDVDPRQL